MSTSINIRLARASDFRNIYSCARVAYSQYVERMGREPAPMVADFARQIELCQVYVAESGSSFVGYVVFYRKSEQLHLENMAVLPAQTGQGIGKILIEYVEQSAREVGLKTVGLYTNEMMFENLLIYPKLGYVETERKTQDGFNRVFFSKAV